MREVTKIETLVFKFHSTAIITENLKSKVTLKKAYYAVNTKYNLFNKTSNLCLGQMLSLWLTWYASTLETPCIG